MAKLSGYLPPEVNRWAKETMSPLAGAPGSVTNTLLQLQARERIHRLPPIGPELGVAHEWIRTQAFNRLYMIQNLYTIGLLNAEVRTAITNIRNEVFRRGLRWIPKFNSKCPQCGREFHETVDECPDCVIESPSTEGLTPPGEGFVPSEEPSGGGFLPLHRQLPPLATKNPPALGNPPAPPAEASSRPATEGGAPTTPMTTTPGVATPPPEPPKPEHVKTIPPDEKQKERFQQFMRRVNEFGQSFEDVLRVLEDDVNITDDAFALILKEYIENEDTGVVMERPIEIYRLHPSLVNFDLSIEGEPLASHWACPIHRNMLSAPGRCEEVGCNLELKAVIITYIHAGTKTYPLFEDEVAHFSKFAPSTTFGFSPLLSIFEKVLTLFGMDKFVYRYFYERKMPAAMLVTATDDPESIRREREYIMTRLQQEPEYLPWVATSARTGRGKTELVRLFHTLQEMDYLPVRNEIRERVAAIYGVTPIWMGAPTTQGGLSGQTSELVVTSRVVEGDQRIYNEKVMPQFLHAFGVTDWSLVLAQPEEKAESTRIQFATQRIAGAERLATMGFTVKLGGKEVDIDDIRFVISGEAQKPTAPGMPGAPGGAGAGLPTIGGPEATVGGPAEGAEGGGFLPLAPKKDELHSDANRGPHSTSIHHRGTFDERHKQESQLLRSEESEEDDEDDGIV